MRPGEHVAWAVAGVFLVTNIAIRAAMNANQKLATRLPKREDRAMYLAVTTCVGSLSVGAGALVAGEVMELLGGWSVTVFGSEYVGYHVLFAASAVLRVASTALVKFLPDRETEHATMRESECRRAA
jgi:predicted MFS family arabinose efflux permease